MPVDRHHGQGPAPLLRGASTVARAALGPGGARSLTVHPERRRALKPLLLTDAAPPQEQVRQRVQALRLGQRRRRRQRASVRAARCGRSRSLRWWLTSPSAALMSRACIALCRYIESVLPAGFKRLDNFSGTFSYEFPHQENCLANLFEELGAHAKDHAILDWGISQTTYIAELLVEPRGPTTEHRKLTGLPCGRGRTRGAGSGSSGSRKCS